MLQHLHCKWTTGALKGAGREGEVKVVYDAPEGDHEDDE